ncbi:inovirus Gp2 family protein [Vibrio sp. YMD68]|uniref:inovirus Gp2 family protein n=1 Tax=Vibrio sp. YMD68 TaxID=3042300 RepID=UPI002499D39A|nr:inovirus Gp2 family protein [Vibrio sp. YMD68]WGW00124.1 inovirus Gp2 family protein [Vibrio sp. YMD68]WGW01210.1 inovirus Gp2 family protein [Vibrio sp. YMD68]
MQCKHFSLHTESTFKGYPVYTKRGPLIQQYLERSFETVYSSLQHYPRTFAIRVDLHLPDTLIQYNNHVINRFLTSLKEQIAHNRRQATKRNPYAHQSCVRYIWCKEQGIGSTPHYHVVLLFNADAFDTLGHPKSTNGNMAARIKKAWLRALNYDAEKDIQNMGTLIHFCTNGTYKLNALHDNGEIAALLYRVSYLCKAETKHFTHHQHQFGRSNR